MYVCIDRSIYLYLPIYLSSRRQLYTPAHTYRLRFFSASDILSNKTCLTDDSRHASSRAFFLEPLPKCLNLGGEDARRGAAGSCNHKVQCLASSFAANFFFASPYLSLGRRNEGFPSEQHFKSNIKQLSLPRC